MASKQGLVPIKRIHPVLLIASNTNNMETIGNILPYLFGGFGGAAITILYNRLKNRIQIMHCLLVDVDTISKIPVKTDSETHSNIHFKEFHLKNTTNQDIKYFKIIFEFDGDSKILRQDTFCKSGKNKLKGKNLKPNEALFGIMNLNRGDDIKFYFDIANISNDYFNVTEAECLGFKIKAIVRMKTKKPVNTKIVSKEILSPCQLLG